uniref:Uncharacterized protein n=1 Tax=Siphoviridae sp. ct5MO18 TaxID=2827779 RepID=A0A8S5T5K6_9CAUD|nr:MAG TPA: hypothetical protein [Siphoviridae sp. ct5MO18]
MKTMERNKQRFFYLLYDRKEPVTDGDGNETGEETVVYKPAVSFRANVSAATGASQVEQFGNLTGYDKVIVTDDMTCPIDENSVLFLDKEPEYDEGGKPLYDYMVKRVAKSLNSASIAVTKVSVS